jgi:hypothetical protein
METYKAPEKHLYFHKDNLKLYGKAVVIREEDDYTIDDFELLNKEEYLEKLKNTNSEEEN